ncbi:MAG: hypothetical protein JNG89_14610 [Planctomycetaceae bacterium]|nr:hypothetical protein [Planctomycetaceae bacterium]
MPLLTCPDADIDLRKCCEFEYILVGDLRDLLEDTSSEENRRWLLAIVDALLDTLPKEFALKSRDGYMAEVLFEFPSWDSTVERLRLQHVALHRRLTELRVRLVAHAQLYGIADRLRDDLSRWIDTFSALQQAERKLTLTAMTLEVGAGD